MFTSSVTKGFGDSTGGTPPDKVKERFELEKGAPKALLGTLENCTRDIAASSGSFDECKEQLKTLLQTLKNETRLNNATWGFALFKTSL